MQQSLLHLSCYIGENLNENLPRCINLISLPYYSLRFSSDVFSISLNIQVMQQKLLKWPFWYNSVYKWKILRSSITHTTKLHTRWRKSLNENLPRCINLISLPYYNLRFSSDVFSISLNIQVMQQKLLKWAFWYNSVYKWKILRSSITHTTKLHTRWRKSFIQLSSTPNLQIVQQNFLTVKCFMQCC